MNRFQVRTAVYHGPGALAALRTLGARRALIVTDDFLSRSDILRAVRRQLPGVDVTVFSGVQPDPNLDVIAEGFAAYLAAEPDLIVAVGGGSSIDTAKVIHQLAVEKGVPPRRCVAVPTTSGSGSEVTSFAVVTDPAAERKYPLVSDTMLPDVSILDPTTTLTVPPRVTADTGMDVLTHALEALVSRNADDFSDAVAEKAVQLVCTHLVPAVADGSDLVARERMHNASSLAGMAFENAGLGITHSIAHALGAAFHLPHGRCNALALPHVMEFNLAAPRASAAERARVASRYAHVARLLGARFDTDAEGARLLVADVRRLSRAVGEPATVPDAGVDRATFLAELPQLARAALADGCTATNPVSVDVRELQGILRQLA